VIQRCRGHAECHGRHPVTVADWFATTTVAGVLPARSMRGRVVAKARRPRAEQSNVRRAEPLLRAPPRLHKSTCDGGRSGIISGRCAIADNGRIDSERGDRHGRN
jgi:hypothetical protein